MTGGSPEVPRPTAPPGATVPDSDDAAEAQTAGPHTAGPHTAEAQTADLTLPFAAGAPGDDDDHVVAPGVGARATPPTAVTEADTPDVPATSTSAGAAPADTSEPPAPSKSRRYGRRARVGADRWSPRLWTKAAIVLLCGLLGLSLATQLRTTQQSSQLSTARQEDLVTILDQLETREQRVRGDISDLQARQRLLNSQTEGSETVLSDLRRRALELGVLAGTLVAVGPGVRLVFRAGGAPLTADLILNAVEELRGAGAEALQLAGADGSAARIVASTSFVDDGRDIAVDGRRLAGPYTMLAIGDGATMAAAMRIPGGVVDSVQEGGGSVQLDTLETVTVSAVREPTTPRYAQPVS